LLTARFFIACFDFRTKLRDATLLETLGNTLILKVSGIFIQYQGEGFGIPFSREYVSEID